MNKTKILSYTALAFLFLLSQNADAQFFSSGQDPASVKWHQINSENFRIIFPVGYEQTAQYVMNTLEYARILDTITLHGDPKKIPVVLHNQTSVSNAMVMWAPGRVEYYSIPPQDSYGQEWFQQLAIHEYRHVIQLNKLNQGLTKVLTYLFGQQITGAVLGLYLPLWFIEGDAVSAETALSHTGRGRSPGFIRPLRTQILEKGAFSYDKAVFGSYRDFTPNRYILGYHIVANSRIKYGTDLWDHVINKVGNRPYMIVPFSEGIRDMTGMTKTKLYRLAMNDLKNGWKKQDEQLRIFPVKNFEIPEKRIFTSYRKPHLTNKGTIIAEKRELDDIARIVEIHAGGNEHVIFTPGYYFPGTLTQSQNLIVWAEKDYDPRWENRSYSVIKTFNLNTGQSKTLTKKTRFFAPDLSPNAEKIVAVEVTEDQKYRLVIVDSETGELLNTISSPDNRFFKTPSWSDDGKKIAVVTIGDKGHNIWLADASSGEGRFLMDFSYADISHPVMHQNQVVFTGGWSGINNLYSIDTTGRQISMITSVKYGATEPEFIHEGREVLFINYTAEGYKISATSLLTENRVPLANVKDHSLQMPHKLTRQAGRIMEPEQIPDSNYQVKKFSRLANLFRFHSWAPLSIDANNYDVKPGVSLMSQNTLSTAFTTLGWEYDLNEETGKYYVNFSYEGWYPAFDFRADYGRRKSVYTDSLGRKIDYSWMETNFSSTVRLPLNLTTNKFSRFLQPSLTFNYAQLDMDKDSELEFRRSNYKTIRYRVYASNLLKSTVHDMYPRWGQILDLNLRTAPFAGDSLGSLFAVETRLFFPGFFRHHSWHLYGGYQKRFDNNTYYGSLVNYPRGFSGEFSDVLKSLAVNYKFPVLYPDLSLSSIAYMKRIKANLFFDYASSEYEGFVSDYNSTGIELFADLHLFRFLMPIELGYRLIYRAGLVDLRHEFLFSINFNAYY